MIEGLSDYAMAIICSSFLLNIIQMILPNSENRKYVIFVCSIIVTIILIEPVISLFNKDYDISNVLKSNEEKYIELEKENYEEYYQSELIKTYMQNIENDIITRLENMGYKVNEIKCEYDEVTLEPNSLYLKIEDDNGRIQPVRIEVSSNTGNSNTEISIIELTKIKSMIKETYGISDIDIN